MNIPRLLAASAAIVALAGSASALTFSTNFDGGSAGDPASALNTADFSFHNGIHAPLQDEFGDDIPGSSQWQIDAASDAAFPVFVDNPANSGYGAAPSGALSLQVIDQTVLIRFAYDVDITAFSVTLDNSGFGNLFNSSINFVNGASVLAGIDVDQTVPGFQASLSGPVSGVRTIVLPTTAFYDDLSFSFTASAVPEPSTYAAIAGGALLGFAAWRRRRAA